MPSYLEKHCKDLQCLCLASPSKRKALIEKANKSLIYSICECIQNILNGNVVLTKSQKKRLTHQKTACRNLIKKGGSVREKKRIIQKGGFLPVLASIALPLVTELVSSLFK